MAAPVSPPSTAAPDLPRLRKAARDFEGMVLGELLAPIFETVDPSASPFGGGAAEAAWRPILTQQIARRIADAGGLGLAQPVLREMMRLQESHA